MATTQHGRETMRRMTMGLWLGVLATLGGRSVLAEPAAAANRPIVLKAAHLFDSVSGTLTDGAVIIVQGNRIQAVGTATPLPADAQVIDLGDATLLPGFIDAHVHLSAESGPNWYLDFYQDLMRFPAEQALYGAHYAKETLEAGFTTVRDVGSQDYVALGLRNAIAAGVIPGPRMLVSNYAIGATAGPIKGVCNGPEARSWSRTG